MAVCPRRETTPAGEGDASAIRANAALDSHPSRRDFPSLLLGAAAFAALYALSQYNYLLFHSLIEILASTVAIAVFMLFWNARRFMDTSFFVFIGVACLFTGILDLMDVLTYQATTALPGIAGDESIQLATAGRWIAGLSFLVAPLFLRRRIKPIAVLLAYSAALVLVFCFVFSCAIPAFYNSDEGTTFSEHIARGIGCLFFLAAAGFVAVNRRELDARVFRLLFAALLMSSLSELTSAVSADFHGFLKVVSHLSEIAAYCLIYKAFVVEGLTKPLSAFLKNQQQGEHRYRSLFESSSDALMTIEPPSWKFTAGNLAMAKMFRLKSPQELLDLGPWQISPQRQPDGRDSGDKAQEMIATALREGSHFFEWTHKRIDGEEFPATVLLTRMEQSGTVLVQATIRDITEQKRAEEVLRKHAAKTQREFANLQAVFDAAQVGFLLTDERAIVVRVNEMLGKIVGRDPAPMLGHPPGDGLCCLNAIMAPAGCGTGQACAACPVRAGITRALQLHEASRGMEVCYPLEIDGQPRVFWLLVSVTPVTLNAAPHVLLAITDISDRKRSERQLRHYAAELEATNDALEKARRLAECANRAKSEFLANMSHEIRTPMTAILGYLDILSDENVGSAAREHIAVIRRNGEHLLQVIGDILDLSKIEAGKLQIEPVDCSPLQLMAEVVSLLNPQAAAKQLNLKMELCGPVPDVVRTDPQFLRQILVNLVGNAIKFTSQGEICLTARLVSDCNPPRLRFDVVDAGIGMSEEHISRLFRPFSQADCSTTRSYGGTGLGLCISKRLAEALGGDIEVRSELGKGSAFIVTIDPGPLQDACICEDNRKSTSEPGFRSPTSQPTVAKKPVLFGRILLVEDSADNQRLISYVLDKAGASVTSVENGQLGVESALAARDAGKSFDVILMDIQMPVMDGFEATRQLRKQGYGGPIIALTASAMHQDRQLCIDAGCNDYLTKPIDRQMLLSMVSHYAGTQNAGGVSLPDDGQPSPAGEPCSAAG